MKRTKITANSIAELLALDSVIEAIEQFTRHSMADSQEVLIISLEADDKIAILTSTDSIITQLGMLAGASAVVLADDDDGE